MNSIIFFPVILNKYINEIKIKCKIFITAKLLRCFFCFFYFNENNKLSFSLNSLFIDILKKKVFQ